MEQLARYEDVVADVRAELAARVDALVADGIARERLVLDPGIGFAKDAGHNWAALAGLGTLRELGRPLLVGASRKRFLGSLLAGEAGVAEPVPVERREDATTAVTALVAAAGAWCVRVHSARASADAVRVVAALQAAAR
jgi:dihydropteroate synthase